jgi:hypothetical protein
VEDFKLARLQQQRWISISEKPIRKKANKGAAHPFANVFSEMAGIVPNRRLMGSFPSNLL